MNAREAWFIFCLISLIAAASFAGYSFCTGADDAFLDLPQVQHFLR